MARGGFTLVEMLVAWLILAILLALIVGVASTVQLASRDEQTRAIQRTVLAALAAYRQDGQDWPDGAGEPDSGAELIAALRRVDASRNVLGRLPVGAIAPRNGRDTLLDSFGNEMQYHRPPKHTEWPKLISLGASVEDPTDDVIADRLPDSARMQR